MSHGLSTGYAGAQIGMKSGQRLIGRLLIRFISTQTQQTPHGMIIGPFCDVAAPEPTGQQGLKVVTSYLARAETFQVACVLLAVDERNVMRPAKSDQPCHGNFGSIGLMREHRPNTMRPMLTA
jgi:hypothetical protein